MGDIDKMLDNHRADTWGDTVEDDTAVYEDERASPLERLQSYVDHCFDAYPVVDNNLDRDRVQCCIADWDRRRGQHRPNKRMRKRVFGKQVRREHEAYDSGNHVVFLARALVGTPPKDDNGVGWKACVRHELGHAIDYEQRGTSDHSRRFKQVMSRFGEESNDGASKHGKAPSRLR